MKKKLTLNEAWRLCLEMWAWIIKQLDADPGASVRDLKAEWARKHGYSNLLCNCFFCVYDATNTGTSERCCPQCPGSLVSKRFNCENKTYDWWTKPKVFYKKLLELNAKRTGKKGD